MQKSLWAKYQEQELKELNELCEDYKAFISKNKTERECIADALERAENAGYISLERCIAEAKSLKPGDCVWASNRGKTLMLVRIGEKPLEEGCNILGAHVDSPRLDVKQRPIHEKEGLVYLDTHYYGGVKAYQWLTMPLAIHGVIVRKDGSVVEVVVGEDEADPAFCISDLLPHLAAEQMKKTASDFIEGEQLDVIIGNSLSNSGEKDEDTTARAHLIQLICERYEIEEDDFLSAELEVVPAGNARDSGFDRSMILGYGQDDRVCAHTSLLAQLNSSSETTSICLLVDKEEIGSRGATSMTSRFFENTMAEICALSGQDSSLTLRRTLANSRMLSNDVSAAYDPFFPSVFDLPNSCQMGLGVTFNKYTGARGKAGSNDCDAEFMASLRNIMDQNNVSIQTSELGRVNAGGGGTIAFILAEYGMQVIDCGVPVLSMHAPWELTNKADIYEAYKAYCAFIKHA